MRVLLRQVGPMYEEKQTLNESRGKEAKFRCWEVHKGAFTHTYLFAYSKMLGTEHWITMEADFKTHRNATLTYRGVAASVAAMYRLELKPPSTYPFVPAGFWAE